MKKPVVIQCPFSGISVRIILHQYSWKHYNEMLRLSHSGAGQDFAKINMVCVCEKENKDCMRHI